MLQDIAESAGKAAHPRLKTVYEAGEADKMAEATPDTLD